VESWHPKILQKRQILQYFTLGRGRAWQPRRPACFVAYKLNLVVIHQFLLRKAKISIFKLHVSSIQLSIARFLSDDPAHFNRPELPVDQFSTAKKHFFINVKGFLLQQHGTHYCLKPLKNGLQKNSVFRPRCC
jgi:hypothetical protein